jgi:hypothetical protein
MEWDKIWAINRKHIDPVAPRHTALDEKDLVQVTIEGVSKVEAKDVPAHPKNADVGNKTVRPLSTLTLVLPLISHAHTPLPGLCRPPGAD